MLFYLHHHHYLPLNSQPRGATKYKINLYIIHQTFFPLLTQFKMQSSKSILQAYHPSGHLSPGILFRSFALHMCPFHISVRIYSILFALQRKLNTLKQWLMHSRVNTYRTKKTSVQINRHTICPEVPRTSSQSILPDPCSLLVNIVKKKSFWKDPPLRAEQLPSI